MHSLCLKRENGEKRMNGWKCASLRLWCCCVRISLLCRRLYNAFVLCAVQLVLDWSNHSLHQRTQKPTHTHKMLNFLRVWHTFASHHFICCGKMKPLVGCFQSFVLLCRNLCYCYDMFQFTNVYSHIQQQHKYW